MQEDEVRKRVRERLKNGHLRRQLPTAAPLRAGQSPPETMAVGSAFKEPCAACGEAGTQIRYTYPTG